MITSNSTAIQSRMHMQYIPGAYFFFSLASEYEANAMATKASECTQTEAELLSVLGWLRCETMVYNVTHGF